MRLIGQRLQLGRSQIGGLLLLWNISSRMSTNRCHIEMWMMSVYAVIGGSTRDGRQVWCLANGQLVGLVKRLALVVQHSALVHWTQVMVNIFILP